MSYGVEPAAVGNSVIVPSGAMRPIGLGVPAPFSADQTLPSGPLVIPKGWLFGVESGNSLTSPVAARPAAGLARLVMAVPTRAAMTSRKFMSSTVRPHPSPNRQPATRRMSNGRQKPYVSAAASTSSATAAAAWGRASAADALLIA